MAVTVDSLFFGVARRYNLAEISILTMSDTKIRCGWVGLKPHLMRYHDEEWGVPVHDDRKHFEMLLLEGAQAGLTWETILLRREGYRKAFAGFDPAVVARFTTRIKVALMKDVGIIRNRLKIEAAVTNARAFLSLQQEFGSFDRYVWRFVGGNPRINYWKGPKPGSGYHDRKRRAVQRPEKARLPICG